MAQRKGSRNRFVCSVLAGVVAVFGWGIRYDQFTLLPIFWRDTLGSGLWTVLIYLLWCVFFPRLRPFFVLVLALLTSFGIEFAQLLDPDWLTKIRSFRLGRLLFGSHFDQLDVVGYSAGGFVAFCLDGLVSFWLGLLASPRR